MPPTTAIVGWPIIIGVILVVYYVYSKKPSAKGQQPQASRLITKVTEKRKEIKKVKKPRKDDGFSSGDQAKGANEKGKKQKEGSSFAVKANDRDEEVDNREFARQLSSAKAGTLKPAKTQEGGRQKSIKQSRAQEKATVIETSSDNGTAGGDADDDRSSLNSPELGATTMASAVMNSDISDMLETPAPGPAVLRITPSATTSIPKKAKTAPSFEPTESKKQRQHRKKNEARKLAREEEERERKVLMEKQRRTAREAEGRAARDGSTFIASKAPSTSAWTAAPSTVNRTNGNQTAKVDLLDTYDPTSSKVAVPDTHNSESEQTGSDWQKLTEELPSEEEQVRQALAESEWKTVSGKEKKKAKKPQVASSSMEEPPSTGEQVHAQVNYGIPPLIAPTGPGQKWAMTLSSEMPDGQLVDREVEVQDSEWEVA